MARAGAFGASEAHWPGGRGHLRHWQAREFAGRLPGSHQSGALGNTLAEDIPSPFPTGSHVTGGCDLCACDREGPAAAVWDAGGLLCLRAQVPGARRPA